MLVESCIPVVPGADVEKSLRFWVEGLGLWLNRRVGAPIKPNGMREFAIYDDNGYLVQLGRPKE